MLIAFRIYELYFLFLYSELIYFFSGSQPQIGLVLSPRVFGNVWGILFSMRTGSAPSILVSQGPGMLTFCDVLDTQDKKESSYSELPIGPLVTAYGNLFGKSLG